MSFIRSVIRWFVLLIYEFSVKFEPRARAKARTKYLFLCRYL